MPLTDSVRLTKFQEGYFLPLNIVNILFAWSMVVFLSIKLVINYLFFFNNIKIIVE